MDNYTTYPYTSTTPQKPQTTQQQQQQQPTSAPSQTPTPQQQQWNMTGGTAGTATTPSINLYGNIYNTGMGRGAAYGLQQAMNGMTYPVLAGTGRGAGGVFSAAAGTGQQQGQQQQTGGSSGSTNTQQPTTTTAMTPQQQLQQQMAALAAVAGGVRPAGGGAQAQAGYYANAFGRGQAQQGQRGYFGAGYNSAGAGAGQQQQQGAQSNLYWQQGQGYGFVGGTTGTAGTVTGQQGGGVAGGGGAGGAAGIPQQTPTIPDPQTGIDMLTRMNLTPAQQALLQQKLAGATPQQKEMYLRGLREKLGRARAAHLAQQQQQQMAGMQQQQGQVGGQQQQMAGVGGQGVAQGQQQQGVKRQAEDVDSAGKKRKGPAASAVSAATAAVGTPAQPVARPNLGGGVRPAANAMGGLGQEVWSKGQEVRRVLTGGGAAGDGDGQQALQQGHQQQQQQQQQQGQGQAQGYGVQGQGQGAFGGFGRQGGGVGGMGMQQQGQGQAQQQGQGVTPSPRVTASVPATTGTAGTAQSPVVGSGVGMSQQQQQQQGVMYAQGHVRSGSFGAGQQQGQGQGYGAGYYGGGTMQGQGQGQVGQQQQQMYAAGFGGASQQQQLQQGGASGGQAMQQQQQQQQGYGYGYAGQQGMYGSGVRVGSQGGGVGGQGQQQQQQQQQYQGSPTPTPALPARARSVSTSDRAATPHQSPHPSPRPSHQHPPASPSPSSTLKPPTPILPHIPQGLWNLMYEKWRGKNATNQNGMGRTPNVLGRPLDFFALWESVRGLGGETRVSEGKMWRRVGEEGLGLEGFGSVVQTMKKHYASYLKGFETYLLRDGVLEREVRWARDVEARGGGVGVKGEGMGVKREDGDGDGEWGAEAVPIEVDGNHSSDGEARGDVGGEEGGGDEVEGDVMVGGDDVGDSVDVEEGLEIRDEGGAGDEVGMDMKGGGDEVGDDVDHDLRMSENIEHGELENDNIVDGENENVRGDKAGEEVDDDLHIQETVDHGELENNNIADVEDENVSREEDFAVGEAERVWGPGGARVENDDGGDADGGDIKGREDVPEMGREFEVVVGNIPSPTAPAVQRTMEGGEHVKQNHEPGQIGTYEATAAHISPTPEDLSKIANLSRELVFWLRDDEVSPEYFLFAYSAPISLNWEMWTEFPTTNNKPSRFPVSAVLAAESIGSPVGAGFVNRWQVDGDGSKPELNSWMERDDAATDTAPPPSPTKVPSKTLNVKRIPAPKSALRLIKPGDVASLTVSPTKGAGGGGLKADLGAWLDGEDVETNNVPVVSPKATAPKPLPEAQPTAVASTVVSKPPAPPPESSTDLSSWLDSDDADTPVTPPSTQPIVGTSASSPQPRPLASDAPESVPSPVRNSAVKDDLSSWLDNDDADAPITPPSKQSLVRTTSPSHPQPRPVASADGPQPVPSSARSSAVKADLSSWLDSDDADTPSTPPLKQSVVRPIPLPNQHPLSLPSNDPQPDPSPAHQKAVKADLSSWMDSDDSEVEESSHTASPKRPIPKRPTLITPTQLEDFRSVPSPAHDSLVKADLNDWMDSDDSELDGAANTVSPTRSIRKKSTLITANQFEGFASREQTAEGLVVDNEPDGTGPEIGEEGGETLNGIVDFSSDDETKGNLKVLNKALSASLEDLQGEVAGLKKETEQKDTEIFRLRAMLFDAGHAPEQDPVSNWATPRHSTTTGSPLLSRSRTPVMGTARMIGMSPRNSFVRPSGTGGRPTVTKSNSWGGWDSGKEDIGREEKEKGWGGGGEDGVGEEVD
ncbi:hypothetical protein HDV00_002687 [Rhizophlyctis rosea]|nr:hypothetical protein HDV00_002687 [Rhizophlyctis rosea]